MLFAAVVGILWGLSGLGQKVLDNCDRAQLAFLHDHFLACFHTDAADHHHPISRVDFYLFPCVDVCSSASAIQQDASHVRYSESRRAAVKAFIIPPLSLHHPSIIFPSSLHCLSIIPPSFLHHLSIPTKAAQLWSHFNIWYTSVVVFQLWLVESLEACLSTELITLSECTSLILKGGKNRELWWNHLVAEKGFWEPKLYFKVNVPVHLYIIFLICYKALEFHLKTKDHPYGPSSRWWTHRMAWVVPGWLMSPSPTPGSRVGPGFPDPDEFVSLHMALHLYSVWGDPSRVGCLW